MSDSVGDGGSAAMQELLAQLTRRPQQSPRSEVTSAGNPFAHASTSPQVFNSPSTAQAAAALPSSASAASVMARVDPTGQDRQASLLNLLNFGGAQKDPASPTPNARSPLPTYSSPNHQHQQQQPHQQHVRGISAADLVGTSMGKPTGHEETTPSPPAGGVTAASTGSRTGRNPQDQLLQLLNKPQQQQQQQQQQSQRLSTSPRASVGGEVKSPSAQLAASPFNATPAKASPVLDSGLAAADSPTNRDSPIRVFGSRESREPTPFEPQDIPTPNTATPNGASTANKGMFTYVNPFEQLAASHKAREDAAADARPPSAAAGDANGLPPNGRSAQPSPTPEPIRKGIAQNIEIVSPAPLADGRTRVEALMGIGAPTADPEVVSQAIENVTGRVEKQAAYEASHARESSPSPKRIKQEPATATEIIEAAGKEVVRVASDVKQELESEDIRQTLEKLSVQDAVSENLQDMDDAAAADDEESSINDDEFQVVPVYNIPLRPFVGIQLTQAELPSLSFRERSITDIARVKKEFDQIDRNLATASNDYIAYATTKKPYGVRVISQEDGKDRQLFKENDPIFNVAMSSSPSGKNHEPLETVIATGTSGAVYWSVIQYDGQDQAQQQAEDTTKHSLIFPPFSGQDGDHTSGGQLKTRAKRSNRHPDFFAIGRGKTIQLVFPFHALSSKHVKKGSVVDTEAYFKERSIKISTGKAGKDFTFSEDDTVLASLDKAGRLRFWDVRDLVDENNGKASKIAPQEVKTAIMTVPTAHVNDKPWPTSVLFVDKIRPYVRGSALRYVIVGMKQNHTLQLWDLSLGKVVQELALPHENESDAICSVAFHPATGIIVVGHPTRNSIYFIHLSAPKYNLQGITQAKYLQAIIQKNPNLPKPESTAIMSGIREYSFASKGQIRSLDLLSSQNSAVDKNPDDEKGQFELYVMHSKGVTCLSIHKADLGWSNDNKVITKVDGEEEGIITVRKLQELKPVDVSEMSSVNGDAVGSTKGISSRARSPLPEPGSKERDTPVTGGSDIPVNGATASAKADKRRKKQQRAEPLIEDMFDGVPPPAPVPPTAPIPPSAARGNTAGNSSKKEPKTPKKEAREVNPPVPTVTLSDAAAAANDSVTSSVNTKQLALPSSTDSMATIDKEVIGDAIQRELKLVESNVKATLSQAFESEFKVLRRGIDEDRRTAEATSAGHQEAVLRLVSQSLTENVDAALNNIVATNITNKVVPAINQQAEKALRKSIPEWLHNNLQQQMVSQIKAAIPEAIGNAMGNQQLLNSLNEGVTSKFSKRLDREMQSSVIPQFQKIVTTATAQTESRVAEQIKAFNAKAKEDAGKLDKLTLINEELLETIRRMAETQSAMRDEMSVMQEELSRLRAQIMPQSISVAAAAEAPVAEAPIPEAVELSPEDRELQDVVQAITEGRFEEGTIQWLQSPNQADIFLRFFINYDPSYLQQCPGLVTLSVGAAVLGQLEDNIPQRLHWLTASLTYLDPLDEEVQTVAPKIMEMIQQRLESRYMAISEEDPTNPALKQIPGLVKRAREIRQIANQAIGGSQ